MPGSLNWRNLYAERLSTAKEVLSQISSGSRVFLGSGCSEPQHLLRELVELGGVEGMLNDVEIVHMLTVGSAPHAQKRFDEHFRHNSFFVGPGIRQYVYEGRAEYTPIFLSEIPAMLRSGRMPLDVALLQVSPPDPSGFCSFGVAVEAHHAAADAARMVIAQVNPQMPRTLGDSFIHVEEIDHFVEFDEPLLTVDIPEQDDVAEAIARNISRLVENGSTIQVGIGSIPNAVLAYLADKKDLGVHTEMFTDGLIDLIEAGVITNACKTFHPGKVIAAFCVGTRRLYDYIDNNPMFEFHPTDYTSSPLNVAKNHKMVAINTALQVDLTGQVCADSLGHRIYSGIGGQADFIRGSALAPDGKPIIALPSTAKDGSVSRIVTHLDEGAGVVTTRGDVHYIATEYGVAYVHGKSLRQRALALIGIAHPKFREQLLAEARECKYVLADQIIFEGAIYPVAVEQTATFGDLEVFIRPTQASDERLFQDFLYHLSQVSVFQRFFQQRKAFPHVLAQEMVAVDYDDQMGLVVTTGAPDAEQVIAAAHWQRVPSEGAAEVAFAVADSFQRRGIGTYLLKLLIRLGREKGIRSFVASVIGGNVGMMRVFQKCGCHMEAKFDGGVITVTLDISQPDAPSNGA
jgi:acyl-CoA hydrolase/RimJ/RimL family protein N-acetyltransferase